MDIITTHTNADLDGLSAMIAAKKIYPQAILVLPEALQDNVRQFLGQQFEDIYTFSKPEQIQLQQVRRLILVDTARREEIGPVVTCLATPGLVIHIYDHHHDRESDICGGEQHIVSCGATTSILVLCLKEKNMRLSEDEATLMALGIHQNTGNFLYRRTQAEDFLAMAWLVENGANLPVVNRFVSRTLSTRQIALIEPLRKHAQGFDIHGIPFVLSAVTQYMPVDNIDLLLQRIMHLDNIDAFFALITIEQAGRQPNDKAGYSQLVIRSRIPEVNAGSIAREFEGGGHASAASATITDRDPAAIEEQLFQVLQRHIRPRTLAKNLMSTPAITVTPDMSIIQANAQMLKYNFAALPVIEKTGADLDGKKPEIILRGMLTRQVAEKAIYHQLGHLMVAEYMSTDIATVDESASIGIIQELMIENRQRIIPVLRGEAIVGVITRTDLLRLLVTDTSNLSHHLLEEDERPSSASARNLSRIMTQVLPKDVILLLREIGEYAEDAGITSYVAGGFVRDLLLRVANTDIDIVVEGDAIGFARFLARKKGGVVHPHEKFSTATVVFPDKSRIDIATARLEHYDHPAAMPTVESSSIKLDLRRRDFTINAMAIHLNPLDFGFLVDFFNSQNDLKKKRICVLHNLSFVEDPTRILRAIRFETRLQFRISEHTEKLIINAVRSNLFGRYAPVRFFPEFKYILSEKNPLPAIQRFRELELLPFFLPAATVNLIHTRRFFHILKQTYKAVRRYIEQAPPGQVKKDKFSPWKTYLLALTFDTDLETLADYGLAFGLISRDQNFLQEQKEAAEHANQQFAQNDLTPSNIYNLLHDIEVEGLLYLQGIARKQRYIDAVTAYLDMYRQTAALVNGKDLKKMGLQPGPLFRDVLQDIFALQLDGKLKDKQKALAYIAKQYPPSQQEK